MFKKINIGLLTNYFLIQKFGCFLLILDFMCVIFNIHHGSYDYNKIFPKNILYKLLYKNKNLLNFPYNL